MSSDPMKADTMFDAVLCKVHDAAYELGTMRGSIDAARSEMHEARRERDAARSQQAEAERRQRIAEKKLSDLCNVITSAADVPAMVKAACDAVDPSPKF